MKKILALLFLLAVVTSQAQYCAHDYDDELFQRFIGSRVTYVQKTGDEEFDLRLEDALAKYWTVSKYKTLTEKKVANEFLNDEVSFLMPLRFTVTYGGSSSGYGYGVMALIMGGKSDLSTTDIIAYAHHDYKEITTGNMARLGEKSGESLAGLKYRIEDIVKGINDAVKLVKENKSKFKPGIMSGLEYMNKNFYNKEIGILKKKTLCVYKGNVENTDKVKKIYPYKIEFLNREDFDEVVAGKRENVVYMIMTSTYSTDALILTDPTTHKCVGGLPFGFVTTIDAGDFKDIVKRIEDSGKK